MTENQVKTNLCVYDRRNPGFSVCEEYGYDKEEVDATGNHAKENCYCDNCFRGNSPLAEEILRLKELIELK